MHKCGQIAALPWPAFRGGHAASSVVVMLLPPNKQDWLLAWVLPCTRPGMHGLLNIWLAEQLEKSPRVMRCSRCSSLPTVNSLAASLEAGRQIILACLGKDCCVWSNVRLARDG